MKVRGRGGFVLGVTLGLIVAVTIIVMAVLAYASQSTRETRIFKAKNVCRLAAQSAIEMAKIQIQSGFADYVGVSTEVMLDPKHAEAYGWFKNVSNNGRTIGIADDSHVPVTLPGPTTNNSCVVYVGVGENVVFNGRDPMAVVPVLATAVYTYPDGLTVKSTLQETVCFVTGQSQVFNYAYFANNYGWQRGRTQIINGDARANGDFYLGGGNTINGFIYASPNREIGAEGKVVIDHASGGARMDYAMAYDSQYFSGAIGANTFARPSLKTEDGGAGYYDAPAYSWLGYVPLTKGTMYNGTYKEGTLAAISKRPIVNEGCDPVHMPFISDMGSYKDMAKAAKGSLKCEATRIVERSKVVAEGENDGLVTETRILEIAKSGVNGDDSETRKIVTTTDAEDATETLVYTKSDNSGNAGRGKGNGKSDDGSWQVDKTWTRKETVFSKVDISNGVYDGNGPSGNENLADKGSVVLYGTEDSPIEINGPVVIDGDVIISGYVKGAGTIYAGRNIHIIGDLRYTEEKGELGGPLGLMAKGNIVLGNPSDAWWRSETEETIRRAKATKSVIKSDGADDQSEYATDKYDVQIGYPAMFDGDYMGMEQVGERLKVRGTENAADRRYYETVCDDSVFDLAKPVTRIDAVMYTNHAIIGIQGGRYKDGRLEVSVEPLNVNGSLICRDEYLYSHVEVETQSMINWDPRILTEANGLPIGPQEPYTVRWQEVVEELNPAYGPLSATLEQGEG